MTHIQISALFTSISIMSGTMWYDFAMFKSDKVRPVLPTWIIMSITMSLSFAMYWTTKGHDIIINACHAISVVSAVMNAIVVFIWSRLRNEHRSFSKFQIGCLIVSGLITAYWVHIVWGLHQTGNVPFYLMQSLLVIAYVVTAEKLLHAKKNTESVVFWGSIAIGAGIALYTTSIGNDRPAFWNALRGTVSSIGILLLMLRIKWKYHIWEAF